MFDAAFQENTELVIVSLYSFAMYSTAATVSGEFRTTCWFLSWMDPPNDQIIARAAMFESSSLDIPIPIGTPLLFLISAPPLSRSS